MFSDSRDEIRNRVSEAADIVEVIGESVQLKRAGARFTGLCPFHGEKTPSFSVNPQGQFFYCFGCGESGDVFAFLMKYHHLSFPEALKELARRYQIDLPEPKMSAANRERQRQREQIYHVNREASRIFHTFLTDSDTAEAARTYLQGRGVPKDFIEQYQLGYAPSPQNGGWNFILSRFQAKKISASAAEQAGLAVKKEKGGHYDRFRDRILFPIYDLSGREVAFGGRILGEGKPKYMNSPESLIFDKSRLLFGLYQHRQAIRKKRQALVVEGNFDLLLLAVHGIDNVVAPLGTALSREHIRSLRTYCDEVVLLFDGDSAGFKAARRSIPFFLNERLEGRVALLPQGHDPDSLVREKGPEGILQLVEDAAPLPEFIFSALVKEHGFTLSGKNRIIAELAEVVGAASDPLQRELIAAHFSEKLGISPARFLSEGTKKTQRQALSPQQEALENEPNMGAESAVISFADLPGKQRMLLDFLVMYPEFFQELFEGGLKEYAHSCIVSVQRIITSMSQLAADGLFMPEQLLSALPGSSERQYVAKMLMRRTAGKPDDWATGRALCDELLAWLQSTRKPHLIETAAQEILQAEETRNKDLSKKIQKEIYEEILRTPDGS